MDSLVNLIYTLAYWLSVFLGVIMGLMKEDSVSFSLSGKNILSLKKGTLFIAFVVCVIASLGFSLTKDHMAKIDKSEQDSLTYKRLRQLENDNSKILADAIGSAQSKTTDAVEKNTYDLTGIFTTNTKQIIKDASTNKIYLKHTIDSLQHKLDSIQKADNPFICFPSGKPVAESHMSNDSFFYRVGINNDGSAGTAVTATLSLVMEINNINYFFAKDGQFLDGIRIASNKEYWTNYGLIPGIKKPSSVWIRIRGEYEGSKNERIPFTLVYVKTAKDTSWANLNNQSDFEQRLKYAVPYK